MTETKAYVNRYCNWILLTYSRFESGLASHGRKQHLCLIVLGGKISDFKFCMICSLIINTSLCFLLVCSGIKFNMFS